MLIGGSFRHSVATPFDPQCSDFPRKSEWRRAHFGNDNAASRGHYSRVMKMTARACCFAFLVAFASRCFAVTIEKIIPFATADRVRIQTTIRGDNTAAQVEL